MKLKGSAVKPGLKAEIGVPYISITLSPPFMKYQTDPLKGRPYHSVRRARQEGVCGIAKVIVMVLSFLSATKKCREIFQRLCTFSHARYLSHLRPLSRLYSPWRIAAIFEGQLPYPLPPYVYESVVYLSAVCLSFYLYHEAARRRRRDHLFLLLRRARKDVLWLCAAIVTHR